MKSKKAKYCFLVDSREFSRQYSKNESIYRIPYTWAEYEDTITIRKKLDVGDYSIEGEENIIVVERKSMDDFVACCSRERDRFERELQRMTQTYRLLLVECSPLDIFTHQYHSKKVAENCVAGSLTDWYFQYGLQSLFVSGKKEGEWWLHHYFTKYLKNKEEGSLLRLVVPPFVSATLDEQGKKFLPGQRKIRVDIDGGDSFFL